jgi:hypothetical protein
MPAVIVPSEARFTTRLERPYLKEVGRVNNWELRSTPGDGDCQFNAIAWAMEAAGLQSQTVAQIRNRTANELQANSWRYSHVFVEPAAQEVANMNHQPGTTYDRFVQQVRNVEWGTELTLMAIAQAYNVSIRVWATGTMEYQQVFGDNARVINIGHMQDAAHYECFIPSRWPNIQGKNMSLYGY